MPQSDAHLILAQAEGGLSCFFLPRLLPDGTRNAIRLERLKDKLGNRSNASSEAEFQDATAWLLGDEGDGVRQILKMGGMTRFDCALGSHGLMRRSLSVALYHALQRQAFGKCLIEQPLMRQVLARMALRLEGHTALLLRLARAWESRGDEGEVVYSRLLTPAAKYRICQQGAAFIGEAMEVLGGIGYCEDSELPRLYREAPVNSIWEGAGNIMCLDVMRSLHKLPVRGQNRLFDRAWRQWQQRMRQPREEMGRLLTQQLFDLCCAAQLLQHASPPIGEAWCHLTLDYRGDRVLPAEVCDTLLQRAMGG
ncbi:putative acyl-CoA dehydrogenase AidB [compost metagenome]